MLLPCWVQACYPPLVPYAKSKTQLDLPARFLPKQETMQMPRSAACNLLPSLVLRTSSHVSGKEQVLNPPLVSLAPGFVQWGDRVQPLGQGGWRSWNCRGCKKTNSDGFVNDEASFSSQITALCMWATLLCWPRGLCWETYSQGGSCPPEKHNRKSQGFLHQTITKPFSLLWKGRKHVKVYMVSWEKEGGGLLE